MAYDFSEYDLSEETTQEYVFSFIPGEPSIITAPAHGSNKSYRREQARLAIERQESIVPKGNRNTKVTPEEVEKEEDDGREQNRLLLSRACAKAWGVAPVDAQGKTHEFSEKECYDFLSALPNWMLDAYANWAANLFNFVKRPPITKEEGERLGNG